jgi:hypothetical protein
MTGYSSLPRKLGVESFTFLLLILLGFIALPKVALAAPSTFIKVGNNLDILSNGSIYRLRSFFFRLNCPNEVINGIVLG